MAAAGDSMLHLFLGCLFLIPTALLIRIIAKFEALYTAYSRFCSALAPRHGAISSSKGAGLLRAPHRRADPKS
jgi:hypothetical protein